MSMDLFRRPWVVTLALAVVIGAIGVGAALLGGGDGSDADVLGVQVTPSPGPTEEPSTPTPESTEAPEPTPEETEAPATQAPATAEPTAQPTSPPSRTPPPTVSAASIDCSADPRFCSNRTGRMTVSDGNLEGSSQQPHDIDYSQVPTTTMTWDIQTAGGEEADEGDPVEMLVVEVTVENRTLDRTFVFPKREIALDVDHSGSADDDLVTSGESFEMPPGGRLEATYEIPITSDGDYRWRAKTWFYEQ